MDGTGARDLGAGVLGLEGFELVAVGEHDGGLELAVQTTNDMVGCPRLPHGLDLGDPAVRSPPPGSRPGTCDCATACATRSELPGLLPVPGVLR